MIDSFVERSDPSGPDRSLPSWSFGSGKVRKRTREKERDLEGWAEAGVPS